jgi:hypothetical protein
MSIEELEIAGGVYVPTGVMINRKRLRLLTNMIRLGVQGWQKHTPLFVSSASLLRQGKLRLAGCFSVVLAYPRYYFGSFSFSSPRFQ